MDKVNSWVAGFTAAITFSVVFTVCALAVVVFPDAAIGFSTPGFMAST